MEDLLKIELVKLQDELTQLDKAVSHISKAEQLTDEVITNSREIQQKYIAQLQTIEERYNEFLEKALTANEEKLGVFSEKQKEQLEALNATLKKYVELGQKTESIAANNLEKGLQQFAEFLKTSTSHTETHVNSLVDAHKAEVEEIRNLIQSYREQLGKQEELGIQHLESSMRNNGELLKQTFSVTEQQVTKLTEAHQKQVDDVNQVFKSYVDLSDSTTQLAREIRTVDFPTRLSGLADDVADFKNTVRNTFSRIEAVERNVAKVNQVDWKSIASLSETLEAQNKKLQTMTYMLYAVGGLALISIVVSFLFR